MALPAFLTKKLLLRAFFAVILLIICAATAFVVFLYGSFQRISIKPNRPHASPSPIASPKPHVDAFNQLDPYNLLLLGYGGGTHEGALLTDSMMVVHIVPQQQKIFLISIPRDIWVDIPTNGTQTTYYKINAAYAIGHDDRKFPNKLDEYKGAAGGGQLSEDIVKKVTGLTMDHFVAMDFSGFVKSIDVLKGVDVKVEHTLDDDLYPIEGKEGDPCGKSPAEIQAITATMSATQIESTHQFPCRYEHLHFDVGVVHMDGSAALKYVRSRHAQQDGGDFNRAARQRNLLLAVKKRVFSLSFFPKMIPFISSLSYDLQTDLSLENMQEFLQYKDALSSYQIVGIALTNENVLQLSRSSDRQEVLIPKAGPDQWGSIQDWLKQHMQ